MKNKLIPENAYLLTASRYIEQKDGYDGIHVSIDIGIFENERDLLRVMRTIRHNNGLSKVQFDIKTITNPRYLFPKDNDIKLKIY